MNPANGYCRHCYCVRVENNPYIIGDVIKDTHYRAIVLTGLLVLVQITSGYGSKGAGCPLTMPLSGYLFNYKFSLITRSIYKP